MTTPALPAPRRVGGAEPDEHEAISQRLIQHAREQLDNGDRLQASEKTWGAMAHILKAVAQERGWNHGGHANLRAVGQQLGAEFSHPDITGATNEAEELHRNFYENTTDAPRVARVMSLVESVLPDLEAIRSAPPRPFVISIPRHRENVALLTSNNDIQIGDGSSVGFSLNHPDRPFQAGSGPSGGSPRPVRPPGPGGGGGSRQALGGGSLLRTRSG